MNIQKLMKQAQQMQKKMKETQEKIENSEFPGESGGGMVKVVINGKGDLKSLKIDPSIIDKDDSEMLEDLIVAAFNNAKKDADDATASEMANATGGMGLPPGIDLPF